MRPLLRSGAPVTRLPAEALSRGLGSTYGLAGVTKKKGRNGPHRTRPFLPDEGPLTTRELTLIELVVKGLSNKEIAVRCEVKLDTVKRHLYNIFSKTGSGTRLELALKYAPSKEPNAAAISLMCDRIEKYVKRIRVLNGEIK